MDPAVSTILPDPHQILGRIAVSESVAQDYSAALSPSPEIYIHYSASTFSATGII
jgi:hypothetical protein